MQIELAEMFVDYVYHNKHGWNVIGSVDTGEGQYPRVKIVVSMNRAFYSIAWDGRQPAMAEWSMIDHAVRDYVQVHYPEHNQDVQFAHSIR